jgi:predicted transcriptional regulator
MDNIVEATIQPRVAGPRHSILDLAPLELECLSVLWPSGESSVREIHRALAASRPRAYTTVLTIMDRLEQKGIVTRRKVGRAFRYQPRLSAEEARLQAVRKIVEGFFDGSPEALAAHLSLLGSQGSATAILPAPGRVSMPRAVPEAVPEPASESVDASAAPTAELQAPNLDERLL